MWKCDAGPEQAYAVFFGSDVLAQEASERVLHLRIEGEVVVDGREMLELSVDQQIYHDVNNIGSELHLYNGEREDMRACQLSFEIDASLLEGNALYDENRYPTSTIEWSTTSKGRGMSFQLWEGCELEMYSELMVYCHVL